MLSQRVPEALFRRAQSRTRHQCRQLRSTGASVGVHLHCMAAVIQAQVVQARLVGAGFGGDRQPGQHGLAVLGLAVIVDRVLGSLVGDRGHDIVQSRLGRVGF